MIVALILVVFVMEVRAETNDGSCKEMLQEYKTFIEQIEKSVKAVKKNPKVYARKTQGIIHI